MLVDLRFLILGTLLLLFPRRMLLRGITFMRRRRGKGGVERIKDPWKGGEPGDRRIKFLPEFTKFRNYIDFLRGAAGSLMLMGGMGIEPAVVPDPNVTKSSTLVMATRGGIMLIGLLLQTVRYEKGHLTFFPAIFYIAGLSVGLCDIRGAAFAFALIWAINPALSNAHWFLTAYAAMLVVFGHFFAGTGDLSVAYAGLLAFLPVLMSLLTKRPLIIFMSRAK